MGTRRTIKKILKSTPTIEGAGVRLKRVFGFHQVPELDPFLLLDDFHSADPAEYRPGFPWHPHRGIETITYMLEGEMTHRDSLGNHGVIRAGDVQWMTAGSGIIHEEMPRGDENGTLWGFQLWANLPAQDKMMDPRYRDVGHERIPGIVQENGVTVKVICGEVGGVRGPVHDIVTDPGYLDVTVPGTATFSRATPPNHTVAAYVIAGSGWFDGGRDPYAPEVVGAGYLDFGRTYPVGPENLVIYGAGDTIEVAGGDDGVRFLLISGRPIREPVAWYGPIVMNTREELKIAFEEYRNGTFIRRRSESPPEAAGR